MVEAEVLPKEISVIVKDCDYAQDGMLISATCIIGELEFAWLRGRGFKFVNYSSAVDSMTNALFQVEKSYNERIQNERNTN
jgi:hypothetical protein